MELVDEACDESRQPDGDVVEQCEGEMSSIKTAENEAVEGTDDDEKTENRVKTKDLKSNDQILNKSKMMSRLLEEIQVSERQRLEMQRQILTLTQKLEESTVLMEKTNTDYIHIKRSLRDSETLIDGLQKDKDSLLVRLDDLVKQNQLRIASDDEIIAAVNQRVEEWKAVFLSKETTILQLQNEIVKLKESMAASNSAQSTTTIAVLSKAVREKDGKIDQLKSELQQATKELEQSAVIIENLNAAQNTSKDNDWQKKQIHSLQRKLCCAESKEEEVRVRLKDAEASAVESERALAEALAQLRAYECSEYGLVDAVQEIKDCRLQLQLRDRQIEDLTLTVDQMEMAVLNLKEENDALKAKLGLEVRKQDLEDILKGLTSQLKSPQKLSNIEEGFQPRNLSKLIKSRIYDSDLMSEDKNKPEKCAGNSYDKDNQSNVFLNEITQQVRLLHSEFRELIQTTKNFKHSSDVVDKVDDKKVKDSHKLDDRKSRSEKVDETLKPVRNKNEQDHIDEIVKHQMKHFEEEAQNNIQNVAKLEKELNEACKTIEELEQKLLDKEKQNIKSNDDEATNAEYPYITKLDSYLSYYLKNFVEVDDYKIKEEKQESEDLALNKLEYEAVLEDYKALLNTLEKPDNGLKAELAEMSRRHTMSKVNERKFTRKCAYLMESESLLRKNNLKLQNDILSLSNTTLSRIHYLEGFKQLASFKIASLHRALEGTVLGTEMNAMERHVDQLMDRQNTLMQQNEQLFNVINTNSQNVADQLVNLHQPRFSQSDLIPTSDAEEFRAQLENIQTENAVLLNEISQLKVINEVAENQVKSLETLHLSKCLELDNVRRQTLDTFSNEDERELIRKLYLQILHLQLNESNLQNKLEACQTQIQKIEVFSLRLEQICDDKDQLLHRQSWQTRNKINRLRNMIRQLLREASERKGELSMASLKLKEDQFKVDQVLKEVKEEKQQVNMLKVELETKNEAVDTLVRSMKGEINTRELVDKYDKVTDLRIQSKKQMCQLEWLSQDLEQSRVVVKKQEGRISFLEAQLTRLRSEQWEHEMAQEKKDSELEKSLISSEKVVILEKDLTRDQMKDNSLVLSEKQEQIKQLAKREKEVVKKVEELEILLSARDQVIAELTSQQQHPNVPRVSLGDHGGGQDDERPTVDVAQAVVETLRARLKQKEETILRYHEIMENAKTEMMTMVENHKKEVNKNQLEDPSINVDKSREFEVAKPFSDSFQQISRMNELQEITVQQDNAIVILADKLKASSKDIQKWQLKVDDLRKEFTQDKEKIVVEYEAVIMRLENELDESKLSSKKLSEDLERVRERLDEQIGANESSPSTQMRKLIDDLKSQLRNKDREAQSLSRTVVSLNNKMKTMVMENACQNTVSTDGNCQRCPGLNKELESAKVEIAFLKRKLKNQEGLLQHLKEAEDKFDKQGKLCSRLKNENSRFQQTIQSLESKLKSSSASRTVENIQSSERKPQLDERSKELGSNDDRWSKIVEKLNLELIEMAKQNALLRRNLEKSRTTSQMESTAGQSKSSAQHVSTDSHSTNDGLNVKIKALMDEIDQLTLKVKEAHSTSEESEMFSDEMQSLMTREAQLRHEVMKLQSENMELMTQIAQLKADRRRMDVKRDTNSLEKPSSSGSEVWREQDKLIREKDTTIEMLQKEILKFHKDKLDASSLMSGDAVISKIVEHNERLVQDYQREVKTNERHRIQLYTMKVENEKLQRQLDDYHNRINKRNK